MILGLEILSFVLSLVSFLVTFRVTKNSVARLLASIILALFLIASLYALTSIDYPLLIGHWPIINSEAVLLYSEDFENEAISRPYLENTKFVTWRLGRLRFDFPDAPMGQAILLPGEYDNFLLEFDVYPVGDVFDASVNILFNWTENSWDEVQVRPNTREFSFFRGEKDEKNSLEWTCVFDGCWVSSDKIHVRSPMKFYLEASGDDVVLWVNSMLVARVMNVPPERMGQILVGCGSGSKSGVILEVDNIRVWDWQR